MEDGNLQELIDNTRARILHALEIFPFLQASAIHQAIGTSTPTQLWRPVLRTLVEEELVCETRISAKTPQDRNATYNIYHLRKNPYNVPDCARLIDLEANTNIYTTHPSEPTPA
jgi:hypothetical protein